MLHQKFQDLCQSHVHAATENYNTESSIGDYLHDADHALYSFNVDRVKQARYTYEADTVENTMDIVYGYKFTYGLETCSVVEANNSLFSAYCWYGAHMYYSYECLHTHDIFGCSGLHSHEHHCILNTPYAQHEYEQLCGKLIEHMRETGEWGEFFPPELSPFAYNETVAQEHFPLSKHQVMHHGWQWRDEDVRDVDTDSVYVPLGISQYTEAIVGAEVAKENIDACVSGVLACTASGRPFRIVAQELAFYIEHSLPLPTKHPDVRHMGRIQARNPRTLYTRNCATCAKEMHTTYASDRPEKVVCDVCYRKEVY